MLTCIVCVCLQFCHTHTIPVQVIENLAYEKCFFYTPTTVHTSLRKDNKCKPLPFRKKMNIIQRPGVLLLCKEVLKVVACRKRIILSVSPCLYRIIPE